MEGEFLVDSMGSASRATVRERRYHDQARPEETPQGIRCGAECRVCRVSRGRRGSGEAKKECCQDGICFFFQSPMILKLMGLIPRAGLR